MLRWQPAYVGVGSNLDDPAQQVRRALEHLRRLPGSCCLVSSRLYRSAPLGPVPQPDFVNAVAGLLTQHPVEELFTQLRQLEVSLGRPPVHEHWGPRVIDLDLLAYGTERRSGADLALPHPGIVERNFVLYPLSEIAPDLGLPGLGRVAELQRRVSPQGLTPL